MSPERLFCNEWSKNFRPVEFLQCAEGKCIHCNKRKTAEANVILMDHIGSLNCMIQSGLSKPDCMLG